jgi:transcription initiation factor TFIID TATA-box-binding protein
MAEPKVCLLIFSSGKIVLTGAKQRKDIDTAFGKIIPVLRKFVKNPTRDMVEKKE